MKARKRLLIVQNGSLRWVPLIKKQIIVLFICALKAFGFRAHIFLRSGRVFCTTAFFGILQDTIIGHGQGGRMFVLRERQAAQRLLGLSGAHKPAGLAQKR